MSDIVEVTDLAGTEALGRRVGVALFPGAVLALVGGLGAGKTHFTRAVVEGVGIRNSAVVTSPTFVLIQEYAAHIPVYHFDAYRLAGGREFSALGVDEYFSGEGICIVEWADRVTDAMPDEYLEIRFETISETARRLTFVPVGQGYDALVKVLFPAAPPGATATGPASSG